MNRITQKFKGGYGVVDHHGNASCNAICNANVECEGCILQTALDRLAAYEDTGLSPAEIISLVRKDARKAEG